MEYVIDEKYADALVSNKFVRGVEQSWSVHFTSESTGVDLYLSKAKKTNNRSVIIHPDYEPSVHQLLEAPNIELSKQNPPYFHDASLIRFPKRRVKPDEPNINFFGMELVLLDIDAIELLCEFVNSEICGNELQFDLDLLDTQYPDLSRTERKVLTDSRIGQGKWRKALDGFWRERCCLTGCTIPTLLRGSHIKPWRVSDNNERLDLYNGLLLRADIDALFDKGMLSFTSKGEMLISNTLTPAEIEMLPFNKGLQIQGLDTAHLPFLEYHREVLLAEV